MLVIDSQRSRWPALELATAAGDGGIDAIYLRAVTESPSPSALAGYPRSGSRLGVRVQEGMGERVSERSGLPALAASMRQLLTPAMTILINQPWDSAWPEGIGLHLRERDPIPDWPHGDANRPPLVGRSVHSPESAAAESAAASSAVDYLLAGHVYPSASKPGKPPLGLNGLARIVEASPCPVIAIGGITADRVSHVLRAGAHGVAVIGAITEAPDPYLATRSLRAAIDSALLIESEE